MSGLYLFSRAINGRERKIIIPRALPPKLHGPTQKSAIINLAFLGEEIQKLARPGVEIKVGRVKFSAGEISVAAGVAWRARARCRNVSDRDNRSLYRDRFVGTFITRSARL